MQGSVWTYSTEMWKKMAPSNLQDFNSLNTVNKASDNNEDKVNEEE
jgi:hypothetical protein